MNHMDSLSVIDMSFTASKHETSYISKVSTRFEFFLSRVVYEAVLILNLIVLDAKFYALSNGGIFNAGH